MAIVPRCEVIPLPNREVSFRIAGREVTRWHAAEDAPRPFFYPVNGPSGETLTRMGHPGAPNHDHHRSVWFAHNKLLGIDFWAEDTGAVIRQLQWYVYEDGDEAATMAVELGWFDGHDPDPLVRQELIVTMRPIGIDEYTLDLQSIFRPTAEQIEFQQTNFGVLAVRMAKSISAHFGEGQLTGADGKVGEPELFGEPNRWMDYSGPIAVGQDADRTEKVEGITYFDHPQNANYPAKWHVRQDGWMGASACRDAGLTPTRMSPLVLRYLLHIHAGPVDPMRADQLAQEWSQLPFRTVTKSRGHQQYELIPLT